MKKFLITFLLLLFVFSMVGCSDKPDEKKTKEDDTPVTEEKNGTKDDAYIFDPLPITFEENEETETDDPAQTNELGNGGNTGSGGNSGNSDNGGGTDGSGNSDNSGNAGSITEITGGQTIETPLIPFN